MLTINKLVRQIFMYFGITIFIYYFFESPQRGEAVGGSESRLYYQLILIRILYNRLIIITIIIITYILFLKKSNDFLNLKMSKNNKYNNKLCRCA